MKIKWNRIETSGHWRGDYNSKTVFRIKKKALFRNSEINVEKVVWNTLQDDIY